MDVVRRHPIGSFLLVAYVFSIVVFAIPLLAETGLGILPLALPGAAPFVLLATISLAIIAFAVTAVLDGRAGVRELRSRAFRFRVSPIWYAIALILLPLAALAAAVITSGTAPIESLARQPGLTGSWLLEIAVAVVLINFWEEIAWTGFLLHRLQPRFGPLRATIATGWAQAAFHLPLLFIIGGLSDNRIAPAQYPFYLAALFVLPLGNRTVLTWLYNSSGNSVPVSGLMHSSWQLATGTAMLPALVPGLSPLWAYAGFAGVAVILIAVTRGRLGYESPAPEPRPAGARPFGSAEVSAQ